MCVYDLKIPKPQQVGPETWIILWLTLRILKLIIVDNQFLDCGLFILVSVYVYYTFTLWSFSCRNFQILFWNFKIISSTCIKVMHHGSTLFLCMNACFCSRYWWMFQISNIIKKFDYSQSAGQSVRGREREKN